MRKFVYITDALQYPYDEGFRKFAFYFYNNLSGIFDTIVLNNNDHLEESESTSFYKVNHSFLDYHFLKKVSKYTKIVYLPLASITFNSIIRAVIISKVTKRQIFLVGLQERKHTKVQQILIKRIKCITYLLLNGFKNTKLFNNVISMNSGVDANKFNVIDDSDEIFRIKNKYSIPINKNIFLHVGHIKNGRNIDDLITLQERVEDGQIVLVSSSSTESDPIEKKRLVEKGIIVIDRYIKNISELYNLADAYLFLVKQDDNFICQPLSVLEALVCGNQIITYDFILKNRFDKIDKGIQYLSTIEDIVKYLSNYKKPTMEQRKRISAETLENYNWNLVINNVIRKVMSSNDG